MPVAFKKCNECRAAKPNTQFEFGSFICNDCKDKKKKEVKDESKG